MQSNDEILILFEGQHLAYSPTITQLYDTLAANYHVTIVAEYSEKFIPQKLSGREVIYFSNKRRKPTFIYKLYYSILSLGNTEARLLRKNKIKFPEYYYRFRLVKQLVNSGKYKKVIAVDVKNLFYCSLFKQKVDFVSLELGPGEHLLPQININTINAVIIQTPERLDHLFKKINTPVFYIQNAPVYTELPEQKNKKGLLYGGTAWGAFGIYQCLDYLRKYKTATLTIQGAVPAADRKRFAADYSDLLTEKRLLINDTYIENDDVVGYFSQFEIGICFYDFNVDWINHFNYRSAPSGKLFKYLAAGIPVLASDISGFLFVNEFECGVLIANLGADQMQEAIEKIRGNYAEYCTNAIKAAKYFSFDKAVKPYLDFVKKS